MSDAAMKQTAADGQKVSAVFCQCTGGRTKKASRRGTEVREQTHLYFISLVLGVGGGPRKMSPKLVARRWRREGRGCCDAMRDALSKSEQGRGSGRPS